MERSTITLLMLLLLLGAGAALAVKILFFTPIPATYYVLGFNNAALLLFGGFYWIDRKLEGK
jgi:hypothetical protein